MPSWDEDVYKTRRRQQQETTEPAHENDDADICARALGGPAGRQLMALLYSLTIDKRNRPNAPESELRELEAKRRLVYDLERLRDKGLKRASEKPKT